MKSITKKWILLAVMPVLGGLPYVMNGVQAADTVTKSYGPMISVTGTAAEQELKIHSGYNKTYTVDEGGGFVGTVVAYGEGNTITVDGPKADLGKDDGKADEVMRISVDANQLVGTFFDKTYKKPNPDYDPSNPESKKWLEPNIRTGDLTIFDPIVAKAERGGTISFAGKNMHINLLYAHKNQHAEHETDKEIHSTIRVRLTGDLIGGDENNELGSAKPDWLQQSGIAGGMYKVGDIETGTGDGHISVEANNITVYNVTGFEESHISLAAKERIQANIVKNQHESEMNIMGKEIHLKRLVTGADLANTAVGNEMTKSLTIEDGTYLSGGRSSVRLQAEAVVLKGGLQFDETKSTVLKAKEADRFTVRTKQFDLSGPVLLAGVASDVQATEKAAVSIDRMNVKEKSVLELNAKSLEGRIGDIQMAASNRETARQEDVSDGTVKITAQSGRLQAGNIRLDTRTFRSEISGLDQLDVGHAMIEDQGEVGNVYHPEIRLEAKHLHIGNMENTKGNQRNYKPVNTSVYVNHNSATITVSGKDTLRLDGAVKAGIGSISVRGGDVQAYRLTAGAENKDEWYLNKASLNVDAKSLQVDTAVSAYLPDNIIDITTNQLRFTPEGKYKEAKAADPENGIPYAIEADANRSLADVGSVWAGRGGEVRLHITEKGQMEAAVSDSKNGIITDSVADRLKRQYARYPEYAALLDKLKAAGEKGKVSVALDTDATWKVTRDSSVTVLQNNGIVDLRQDNGGSTLTVADWNGNGKVLMGVVPAGTDTVSDRNADSTPASPGAAQTDATAVQIQKYAGGSTFTYMKDAQQPDHINGGDIRIQSADPDAKLFLEIAGGGDGSETKDTLNALAGKLYYTGYVTPSAEDGERNLKATVRIPEGRVSLAKTADVLYRNENGQGYIESVQTHSATSGLKETRLMRGARESFAMAVMGWRDIVHHGLHQARRLHDVHAGEGIWANITRANSVLRNDIFDAKGKYTLLEVGYDMRSAAAWRAGIGFQYADGNATYLSDQQSKYKTYGFTGYATRKWENGTYLDTGLQLGRLQHEMQARTLSGQTLQGDLKTNGIGLAVQYGKHIAARNGFYWEPQVGLSVSRLAGADVDGKIGNETLKMKLNPYRSVIGSLGIETGVAKGDTQWYMKLGWLHEWAGNLEIGYMASDGKQETKIHTEDSWAEVSFGGTYHFTDRLRLDADLMKSLGGDYRTGWKANVQLSYRF